MIPQSKGWNEVTYEDELPAGNVVRVNRRTVLSRLRNCKYLLKRGGGIFHEPGGKVIAKESLHVLTELIEAGSLVADGPAGRDMPDATVYKFRFPT